MSEHDSADEDTGPPSAEPGAEVESTGSDSDATSSEKSDAVSAETAAHTEPVERTELAERMEPVDSTASADPQASDAENPSEPEIDPATLCALNTTVLRGVGERLGIALDEAAVARYERLAAELVVINAKMNITRLTQPDEIAIQHIVDSLLGLRMMDGVASGDGGQPRVLDVGSGAGFPGLALAIAHPKWNVTLLDARAKVVTWLEHVARVLELENVTGVHARAEDAANEKEHRARYDIVVARAVAGLPTLLELTLPFARVGGRLVAWKGESADDEVAAAQSALSVLGGKVTRRHRYTLPGLDRERVLVVVEKRRKTPRGYPRKAGTPKRKPL